MWWVVNATPRPLYLWERPGTHCIEGWVWAGVENLAPTGIRSPDRPARSESLFRLSFPDPHLYILRYDSYTFTTAISLSTIPTA